MQYVYKPKQSKTYRARYTVGESPRLYDVTLKTRDREDAVLKLRNLVHEEQEEQRGNIAPRRVRETASQPVEGLFSRYVDDLEKKGCAHDYIKVIRLRLSRLFAACKWEHVSDIHAMDFLEWRRNQSLAPKTLNHYLDAPRAFLNWLVKQELLEKNPLEHLDKVDNRVRERDSRRAFTPEELKKLLNSVTGRNEFAYRLLLCTGLRVREARNLQWRDVDLESEEPRICLRAEATKSRRADIIPIPRILADMLRLRKPNGIRETARVITPGLPEMRTFEHDLRMAGIALVDDKGRGITRHTFRRTYVTILQIHLENVPPLVAQHLARHHCLNLTDRAYTDRTQLPLAETIEKFDHFIRSLSLTRNLTHNGGNSGANLSKSVQTQFEGVKNEKLEEVANEVVTIGSPSENTSRSTSEVVPREGIEPSPLFRERILSPQRLPFRHRGFFID
jgi:integrase